MYLKMTVIWNEKVRRQWSMMKNENISSELFYLKPAESKQAIEENITE